MRIRDAVHGDITLSKLEEYCIRTPTFQRLHRIKQLGNAFHVYPSAMHTRFEHSLGVCHQIQRLFSQPKFWPPGYKPEPEEETKTLIRLAGLLHDIVHTPFKHTFERDTAILPEANPGDEYGERIENIVTEEPELKKSIRNGDIDLLVKILSTKEEDLPEPYMRQIVEDTLSADLLDYTRRDAYFTTGLIRRWDDRIYDHIAVAHFGTKLWLVARITDEYKKESASAITELMNLLEIRYVLHERVYFYPVKIAADALLVKSLRGLLKYWTVNVERFKQVSKDFSDEELVNYLVESETPRLQGGASRRASSVSVRSLLHDDTQYTSEWFPPLLYPLLSEQSTRLPKTLLPTVLFSLHGVP